MDNRMYEEMKAALDSGVTDLREHDTKNKEIEAAIKSGNYSGDYLKALYDASNDCKRNISSRMISLESELKAIAGRYADQVARKNELNAAELNEDAKLLSCGIPLRKNDVEAILERNRGNATMTRLALNYAKEKKMDAGLVGKYSETFITDDEREIEGLLDSALRTAKHYNMTSYDAMYSTFFGGTE